MTERELMRISAIASIAGGLMRMTSTFAGAMLASNAAGLIYFATDVFLLAGLMGIYLPHARRLGTLGFAGAALAFFALIAIRSAFLFPGGYQFGAVLAVLGMGVLSFAVVRCERKPVVSAILWLVALAATLAAAVVRDPLSTALAGLAFGAGFVSAGWVALVSRRGTHQTV